MSRCSPARPTESARHPGERLLSGSFCISGSGHYVAEAVREESYAGRLAGEARAFRHPPSPLQEEVNRVILASIYVMIPLAAVLLFSLKVRNVGLEEAAETATAGLVTLIPEGLVLADERHLRGRRGAPGAQATR